MRKRERGSFTIEAILSLTTFMFAFMTIVSWATIAKVESTTQYAIDQIAKEVAQYYYVAERLELTNTTPTSDKAKEVDDTIDAFLTFTNTTSTTASQYSNFSASSVMDGIDLAGIRNDAAAIVSSGEALYNSASALMDDPVGVLKAMATMMAQTAVNETASRLITQPICKALMPRYLTNGGDRGDADALLKRLGVVDGMDGLNFGMSSFLRDQRSVNVVLVYQIKVNGFGFFDDTLVIRQTASTAAWVKGRSISEAVSDTSKWTNPDVLMRGKEYVQDERGADKERGVAPGVGVTLYDQDTNTFTSVHSMNVFFPSYSKYQGAAGDEANIANYEFKKSGIKRTAKEYCKNLASAVGKIGDSIKMDDGTELMVPRESIASRNCEMVLIVPLEVKDREDCVQLLAEIAKEIEDETGVKVTISYRELAFPDAGGA